MIQRVWNIIEPHTELQRKLCSEFDITPITAQLLVNRGIVKSSDVENFLNADLSRLHDPHALKDMDRAAARIKRAVSKGEKIMIYGDYDADGISAVALLKRVIGDLGGNPAVYIPNRIEEGYGLNKEAVKTAHRRKISLLITVDCGISAKDEIEYLHRLGITSIVTDHHKILDGAFPVSAYAVINPLQDGCAYPFKQLSGVAIAYKLAQVLTEGTGYEIRQHLDLVALGTVQDMVPQLDENRVLTKEGLAVINHSRKCGIRALISAAGLDKRKISVREIGYMLGPRINAAGRVGSAKKALRLLTTDDEDEAEELAKLLDEENRNRQRIENAILRSALQRVESRVNFKDERVIVLDGDGWHPGVIGIVASRIAERFNRPTIIISFDGKDEGKGSGRSIKNFHLFEALAECKDVLTAFGGHAAACGLKIERKSLGEFRSRLNGVAAECLDTRDFIPSVTVDMTVPLRAINPKLIDEFDRLAPFGPGNPRPVLASTSIALKSKPRRIRRDGIKMWVTDRNVICEAIGFGMGEIFDDILESASLDLAYTPSLNTWGGVDTIQLELVDVKTNLL